MKMNKKYGEDEDTCLWEEANIIDDEVFIEASIY